MDDEFFSDDEAFEALGETELAALEENAVLECTQPAPPPQPYRQYQPHQQQNQHQYHQQQQQQQQQHGRRNAGATVSASRFFENGNGGFQAGNKPAPIATHRQQPQAQWERRTNHQRSPENTNYGAATVPTLRDVTLPTHHSNSQTAQNAAAGAAPAEYNHFNQTTELWDTVGPAAKGPSQLPNYFQHDNGGARQEHQGEDVYDMDYGGGDMDDLLALPAVGGNEMPVDHGQNAQSPEAMERLRQMQEKIDKLEAELTESKQTLQKAESNSYAKAGEISIVRNNIAKMKREHERLVQSMQAHQNEEREKYERELSAAKAEAEAMRTRNMFLNNDYEEVIRKNKALERSSAVGESTARQASPMTTPKKKKFLPHRDGFDDDEIMVSPSKSQVRGRGTTPSKKRKRLSFDSPGGTLPLSPARQTPTAERGRQVNMVDEAILEKLWQVDTRFDFFDSIIAYQSSPESTRIFESLSKYSLPSSPETTLSSIFLENISTLRSSSTNSQFPTEVCRALLSIWRKLLSEKYWAPFHLILDLIHFGVMWDQGNVCIGILDEAVDLIQRTVDINAIPRVRQNDLESICPEIDVPTCLVLMESIALGAMLAEAHSRRFWKLARLDFVFMMLSISQPVQEIELMLKILCTGVFSGSFGPQASNEGTQRQNESHILDVVTRLLIEAPDCLGEDEIKKRPIILRLRKEVIKFLGCVVGMEGGTRVIANHPTALSRLIRRIADQLEEVYDFRWDVRGSVEFVNASVRLLHGILTTNTDIQLGTKLTGGATHKHLVAMTRLAFSEGLLQERGIEEEVVEYAHAILELSVTPQEGEALQSLFAIPGRV